MNGTTPKDPGYGPPPGLDPFGESIPMDRLRQQVESRVGGNPEIVRNDPAFQPPGDPLLGAKARSGIIYRDLPVISIQNQWTVASTIGALAAHTYGVFAGSGQLVDSIIADPRVRATLDSRMSGLFSREMRFKPANDSREAKEACDAWIDSWPYIASGGAFKQIGAYSNLFGFWPSQLVWNDQGEFTKPRIMPWHARYTFYQWDIRRYVAISQDGTLPIFPGDGKWVLHAPRGEYRGWMWGSIRAIAEPWLLRHFAFRDMARFSEVHGMPFRKGIVPAAAAEDQRQRFENQLANLGTETTMILPRGVDGAGQDYDVELVEATSQSWQIFPGLVDRCDMDIVLAILMQNLTTEVTGGSFAATNSHMDIRQQGIEDDNEAFKQTIHDQIARPFAALNFGDADLAPWTDWNVTPREDMDSKASRFYSFGQSLQILRQGGVKFTDEAGLSSFAKSQFGIDLPSFELTEPDNGAGTGAAGAQDEAASKQLKGSKGDK
jgi:hypothetical protein